MTEAKRVSVSVEVKVEVVVVSCLLVGHVM